MTDNGIELTRRKILSSMGAVGVAGATAGLGTSAYFSDEESFTDNTITAGELDLKIDWQQMYHGPADEGAPYGEAGKPYINAHPDHNEDGRQSLNTDQFDSVNGDGVVTYEDSDDPTGANIQEYLTCETLSNFTVPDDFDNGNRVQDNLIELTDVKPGDSGEITFSFHLCDNPGYVWFTGGNFSASENGVNEPEADAAGEDQIEGTEESPALKQGESGPAKVELQNELEVRAWYDLDCNNVFDSEDTRIFARGTLDDLLGSDEHIAGQGLQLNPDVYEGFDTTDDGSDDGFECLKLGKIELEDQINGPFELDDDTDEILDEDSNDNDDSFDGKRYKLKDGNNYAVIDITNVERKDPGNSQSEIIGIDFELDDASPADLGICRVDVKGGGGNVEDPDAVNTYTFTSNEMRACVDGVSDSSPVDLKAPTIDTGGGTKQTAISNVVFYYCPPEKPEPDPCFPSEETFCVGFEWWLPSNVGNEIQSDSVSFDLGFYTEQCRHNDDPGQTL